MTYRLAVILAVALAVIGFFRSLAPKPVHQRVDPASLINAPITGNPCGMHGPVLSATLSSSMVGMAGTNTYQLVCSDGMHTLYTAP